MGVAKNLDPLEINKAMHPHSCPRKKEGLLADSELWCNVVNAGIFLPSFGTLV